MDDAAREDAGRLFDLDAAVYDRTRRQLIPCFDAFYGTALTLLPFARDARIRVLDLGAGTGMLAEQVARAFPRARFTLVDVAERMLAIARRRFAAESERFTFLVADLAALDLPPRQHVVTSALAIHHLEDDDKRRLFARVHAALEPGGVFVNAEQVLGPTAETERAWHDAWLARARAAGVAEVDLAAALARMTADRAAPLAEQLAWLRDAGFRDVRCAFQEERFALYGGVR
ncbi:MAG: class I SAM-dependent methyltransferase [Thermodesulfobacteriota bacterium]